MPPKNTSKKASKKEQPAAAAPASSEEEREQQRQLFEKHQMERKNQWEKYLLDREQRIADLIKPSSELLSKPTLVCTNLGREFMGRLASFDAAGSLMLLEALERFRDPDDKNIIHRRFYPSISIPAESITKFLQRSDLPRDVRVEGISAMHQVDVEEAEKMLAAHEEKEKQDAQRMKALEQLDASLAAADSAAAPAAADATEGSAAAAPVNNVD